MDGFGSSSELGAPFGSLVNQGGFGSPSRGTLDFELVDDWGFGSPTPATAIIASVVGRRVVPKNGGHLVTVRGDWTYEGPYRVRLVAADGAFYPSVDGCFAPPLYSDSFDVERRGAPWHCTTTRAPSGVGQYIRFATPRCPPGVYDVRLDWLYGPTTIVRAVQVVESQVCPQALKLRALMPPRLKTGAASVVALKPAYRTQEDV